MSKKKADIYIAIAVMTIIFLASVLFNAYMSHKEEREAFTSSIRSFYRPHVRNARLLYEGFYDRTKNNFNALLRKFGLK